MDTHTHTQTHTPGPWHMLVTQYRIEVATMSKPHSSYAFSLGDEANARLIAAAPELLAHLKMLVSVIREGVAIPSDGAAVNAALEVIAKAERGDA